MNKSVTKSAEIPAASRATTSGSTAKGVAFSLAWAVENFHLFESSLNGSRGSAFHEIRKAAFEAFTNLGLPTPKVEEWKYTDIQPITRHRYGVPARLTDAKSAQTAIRSFNTLARAEDLDAIRVTVVNGSVVEVPESRSLPRGVLVTKISEVLAQTGPLTQQLNDHLNRQSRHTHDPVCALNMAFARDGIVIAIDKEIAVAAPIVLTFVTDGSIGAEKEATGDLARIHTAPRVFIFAAAYSSCQVVEHFVGQGEYFTTAVTESVVAEGGRVSLCRIEDESLQSTHLSIVEVTTGSNAEFHSHQFSFGGNLVRNEIRAVVDGSGDHVYMDGLSVLAGSQHVDNTTVLDHAKPQSQSTEQYKGIYGDRSHGVFSGTIIVRPDAQKTNAIQSNKAILLSDLAKIDARPQLKIWADDVKCTHGATVGQLDEHALFYIRSRGVPKAEARNILIHAFASDLISGIPNPAIQSFLEGRLMEKLKDIQVSGLE